MNTLINKGLIKEIQEWAYIYFVRFVQGRPLFISKKNQEVQTMKEDFMYDHLYEQEKKAEAEFARIDDIESNFANYESIKYGSVKQKEWASKIFSFACRSLAIDVFQGNISEAEALKILTNQDAKWWIDNRQEWVSY